VFGDRRTDRAGQAAHHRFLRRGSSGHVGVYLRYLSKCGLATRIRRAPSVVTAYQRPPELRDALFVVCRSPGVVPISSTPRRWRASWAR
jgi:hypothetical protein